LGQKVLGVAHRQGEGPATINLSDPQQVTIFDSVALRYSRLKL
jgi:hypothetical protein